MKKISLWSLILVFSASVALAQESATQQQIDKLTGQIQDLMDIQAQQGKRIEALERGMSELRDKLNAPVVNDYASHAELKSLVEQMDEIDRKRKEDTDNIAEQIKNLAKVAAAAPAPIKIVKNNTPKPDNDTPAVSPSASGYEYEVKQGDTLGLIAKAYRDKGVKVTRSQIIAANPKINPNVLIPGRKIFIPDPSAK